MATGMLKGETTELTRLRRRLQQEREAVLLELKRLGTEPIERKSDFVDEAANEAARDFTDRLRKQLLERLEIVENAEERLRGGAYGVCAFCQEPIPSWRLEAIPWAALCLRCQELTESMR
jgi:DnaK suppressor protein